MRIGRGKEGFVDFEVQREDTRRIWRIRIALRSRAYKENRIKEFMKKEHIVQVYTRGCKENIVQVYTRVCKENIVQVYTRGCKENIV